MQIPKRVPERGFYYSYRHEASGTVGNYACEFLSVGFHRGKYPLPGEDYFVIYRPLDEGAATYQASLKLGVPCTDNLPIQVWMEEIPKGDGTVPRFQKITDPRVIAELTAIRDRMYPVS